MKAMLQQHLKAARPLSGVASFAAVAGLMATFAQPAAAANVSGQAIDATSILSGTPPTAPFLGNANAGETFEIDLSNVLTSNSADFNLNNLFSLQFANLNTGSGLPTVNLSDLQLEVTGEFASTTVSAFTPIAIWASTENGQPTDPSMLPAFLGPQTSQGAANYTATVGPASVTNAFKKLAISLTPTDWPGIFGTAGVINTSPARLSELGVTSLTGLKITGKIAGYTGQGALAAGLGIYTGQPAGLPTSPPFGPNVIYGNALTYGVPAPGPLPLLGAGAAFGMSRRLRRRISASKVAA